MIPSASGVSMGDIKESKLFVELYELEHGEKDDELRWQETARWIKYEEDAVGVDHRFGLPRLPCLSLNALLVTRRCFAKGVALLDLEETDFLKVCDTMADHLLSDLSGDDQEELKRQKKDQLLSLLTKHHHHGNDHRFSLIPKRLSHAHNFSSSRNANNSSPGLNPDERNTQKQPLRTLSSPSVPVKKPALFRIGSGHRVGLSPSPKETVSDSKLDVTNNGTPADVTAIEDVNFTDMNPSTGPIPHMSSSVKFAGLPERSATVDSPSPALVDEKPPIKMTTSASFHAFLHPFRRNHSFHHPAHLDFSGEEIEKKVGHNAESAQVFVGLVPDFGPIRFAFVRLKKAVEMPELLTTRIPVRFLFCLIGHPMRDVDYHEVGRSIATLMSNPQFQNQAYAATSKADLLAAVDEVLDESVVIPQGDIDHRGLFTAHDLQKALRKRRKKKMEVASEMLELPEVTVGVASEQKVPSGSDRSQPYNPLSRTGRPFYGLIQDAKRRFPLYPSDFTDALHVQCVISLFFMFFAVFAPAIAFGGLLGGKTDEYMGVFEVLVAQSMCGVLWGLFSCQPLMITAATGPILVFEGSLYEFCQAHSLNYLVVRVWVSIWACIIGLFCVMLEGSFLVRFVTRFTEDVFALLISLIFVYESIKFVLKNFTHYHPVGNIDLYCCTGEPRICSNNASDPSNDTLTRVLHRNLGKPDTALLSGCLFIATFALSYYLKQVRSSHYFGRTMRRAIGDFGVPIAIFVVGLVQMVALPEPYLQKLEMPSTFGLTSPDKRPWLINPFGESALPVWAVFATFIPAFLVFILLFVETEITELILLKPERGLRKGAGLHWDMLLVGMEMLLSGFLGLPWMCPAAVESLAHCSSLTVMHRHAPGERPQVDKVIEQRVTTIGIALAIGACAWLGSVLRHIPLAVLFGVFMYLGIMSMAGNHVLARLVLFIIPQKYYPDQPYCREVKANRMHVFTVIQIMCLIGLWMLKTFPDSALAFPFALMLMCVARIFLMPKLYTEKELIALDGEESDEELEEEEPDFYNEVPLPF